MIEEQGNRPNVSDILEAAEKYGRNIFINECMKNGVCDDHDLSDAFIAGAEWQKEQMLKDAVEAEVQYFGETQGVPRTIKIPRMQEWLKPFKDGDKVRVIIVKEDER